jgi:hypothetical protein
MAKRTGSPNYVEFPFDKEVVVTLREDRGSLRSNHMGDYFLRHFQDDLFSCCSPDLERRILDIGARAGSVVSITKEKYGRSAVWVVKLLGSAAPEPAKPQPVKANGHSNGHAAPVDHAWRDLPAEKYAPSNNAPDRSKTNGNGSTPHTLEDQLKASIAMVQAEKPREAKNLLERAAVAAVDCAIFIESYAAQHGRPFTVPAESIAAWASTLFINAR